MDKIDKSEILYVTIKKVFFDQILSGEKTEEYREPTDYWIRRLITFNDKGEAVGFKPYKYIRLCVGYNKDREEALVEINEIALYQFINNIPEGFEKGDESFVISLGKVISKKLH